MAPSVTGVMLVKNQEPTVGMALRSVEHVVDAFHIIDNASMDRTRDAVEAACAEMDVPTTVETRPGDAGDMMEELINERVEEYALRVEGDQIHWPDRVEEAIQHVGRETTVCYRSFQLQNRFDLQNERWPTNPPHPMIYDAQAGVSRRRGMIWPRGNYRDRTFLEDLIGSVNARVHKPIYRFLRWHRTGGSGHNGKWWNRPPSEERIPEQFKVPEVDPPYWDHFTIREYVRLLRERGKGSLPMWPGDTLEEAAEDFIEWDMAENCEPYEGDYPPLLAAHIEEHGMGWP